ncbi:hypothetical protein D3C71_1814680 [compost metagenome]
MGLGNLHFYLGPARPAACGIDRGQIHAQVAARRRRGHQAFERQLRPRRIARVEIHHDRHVPGVQIGGIGRGLLVAFKRAPGRLLCCHRVR